MRRPALGRVGLRRLSAATGGGGGGVTTVNVTAPITKTGPATAPNIGISAATTGAAGSMSAADKTKLDGITPGASIVSLGVTAPITNTGTATAPVIAISAATTGAAGSMSAADKTKLDGITAGASIVSLGVTSPITNTGTATAPVVAHANSGLGASTVAYPASITFDATGHPSAATAGSAPVVEVISDLSGTGTSVSSASWTANRYRKIEFELQWQGTVTCSGFSLTGLSAATYSETLYYTASGASTISTINNTAQSNWLVGGSSNGPATLGGTCSLPPAPARKAFRGTEFDPSYSRTLNSYSTDGTNDPTRLNFTFGGSTAYTLKVWGFI